MTVIAPFRRACRHITLFGYLTGLTKVRRVRVGEIVVIDEIVAGVVGRIDVDQLYPPEIRFVEKLQNLKVFPFDERRGVRRQNSRSGRDRAPRLRETTA
jgi:hypothetical protein